MAAKRRSGRLSQNIPYQNDIEDSMEDSDATCSKSKYTQSIERMEMEGSLQSFREYNQCRNQLYMLSVKSDPVKLQTYNEQCKIRMRAYRKRKREEEKASVVTRKLTKKQKVKQAAEQKKSENIGG